MTVWYNFEVPRNPIRSEPTCRRKLKTGVLKQKKKKKEYKNPAAIWNMLSKQKTPENRRNPCWSSTWHGLGFRRPPKKNAVCVLSTNIFNSESQSLPPLCSTYSLELELDYYWKHMSGKYCAGVCRGMINIHLMFIIDLLKKEKKNLWRSKPEPKFWSASRHRKLEPGTMSSVAFQISSWVIFDLIKYTNNYFS